MSVPDYIADRIRRNPPQGCHVIDGSTPVVGFGDWRSARLATLGLNPGKGAFFGRDGNWFDEGDRRLATLASLGLDDLTLATDEQVVQVLLECDTFFERVRGRWFNILEGLLTHCGVSYYDGSACHLDVVQWATDPAWGKLTKNVRQRLIEVDGAFLRDQLANSQLQGLLVNGSGAIKGLRQAIEIQLEPVRPIEGYGRNDTKMFVGRLFDRITVVGWSTNLQSSFGVRKELRAVLAERVAGLISEV